MAFRYNFFFTFEDVSSSKIRQLVSVVLAKKIPQFSILPGFLAWTTFFNMNETPDFLIGVEIKTLTRPYHDFEVLFLNPFFCIFALMLQIILLLELSLTKPSFEPSARNIR